MAGVLLILSGYHYTQPNAAWLSGTAELILASSLLTAAYLASPLIAIVINLVVAFLMTGLGIRHAAIGGGWVSGSIELTFAAILVVIAVITNRDRKRNLKAPEISN